MKKNVFLPSALSILAAISLAALSCAQDEKNEAGGPPPESPWQLETEQEKLPAPELPEMDLGARDFVFLTNSHPFPIWDQRDIYAETENGDRINDAVYRRNSIIEAQFNCKIREMKLDAQPVIAQVKKFALSGDDFADAVNPKLMFMDQLIESSALFEFGQLPHNDLSKPWWDPNCVRDLSVSGKIFGVASDITLIDKGATNAMVFKKQLHQDCNIENLYQLVAEGKWTLDKLFELSRAVSKDLDGNGIRDDKDAYGLLYQRDSVASFMAGAGGFIASKNESDLPVMTLNDDRTLGILDKIFDMLYNPEYCFHVMKFFDGTSVNFTDGMTAMFQNNQALFMWIRIADAENLRAMPADFGILPLPKYDDRQPGYMAPVSSRTAIGTSVPISAKSAEESSAVLEAMAYHSRAILQPEYYDVLLASKVARDDESGEMLDIIYANRVYDIGDAFDFGGIYTDLIYGSMDYNRNIASMYEKKESAASRDIEKLVGMIK